MRKYGWRPDTPDRRDRKFAMHMSMDASELPVSVDLRPLCPPIYDQGNAGSCVAQSVAAMAQFLMIKSGHVDIYTPSRLWIYYCARQAEGNVYWDSGTTLRTGMKVIAGQGLPHEKLWWYNPKKVTVKPNKKVFEDGLLHLASDYERLDNLYLTQLKSCLASGFPFVFGFSVYESFETKEMAQTGIMPLPGPKEVILGAHAVMAVGYSDETQMFIVRNSWGCWAQKGYFMMPYSYITDRDLADDFWTCRKLTQLNTVSPLQTS